MFSRTPSNASATMDFSATATARTTWPGAGNSWLCPRQSRHRNATTGNGGNTLPGTIHCSVRSAAPERWCASPSFPRPAPSEDMTAHRLCSPTHWVWPALSVARGHTTPVSRCQFSSFDNAPYPWNAVSPPLPHQQYRCPRGQFTTCHEQDHSSPRPTRSLVAIQNT